MKWYKLFFYSLVIIAGCRNAPNKEFKLNDLKRKNAGIEDTAATIKKLEQSFSLRPTINTGLTLANLYAETKDERVIALCDALLKKDTARELTDAVFIKGIYYANINDRDQAIKLFEECIKRDWKFIEAYMEKGIIQYEEGDINGALKTFQLAVEVANTYPDAYYWTGRCFEKLGNKQEASDYYSKALALDKDFSEAKQGIQRLDSKTL